MAINKVEFGDQTLMDLTGDTVTPEDVLNGATFHDRAGVSRSGTASYPVTDVQVNNTSVLDGTVAKITQGTAATKDVPASGNASTSQVVMGNDTRLTDSRNAKDVYAWAKASTKPSYTASEVGLGNVPNVTTDNQTPTVTEASTRANIATGDTLKTIIGKIKKFFTDLKTVAFTGSYNDLTNKPTIPAAQVNSDWNATSGVAQILNKPTIPTVNNATLTIQKNGTNVQTFTANQSTNTTANITVPTKVSELTNDSGYTTNTGTVTSVAAGTGLSGGTITSSGTISLANHSADYLSGGYLNIHPENSPTLIPFMNNDIAYLLKRGGSAIVKYDGTTQSVDLTNCFDASPSYWAINPTNITTVVIELTLHKVFAWTNTIYVDFGSSGWRAKNVKIEVMNSNYAQDVWTQKYNNTNNGLGHCYVVTSHTPVGASNAGGGFNKVRFTFSSWNNATIFRIAQMGIYNYGSAGLRETFVPRDGGTLFGPLNLSYTASATMTYNSYNPQILFSEHNGSQGVKILYTDHDSYRAPYGLKIIGDGSATGGAWFEVEGNLYSNGGKQVPFLSTTPTSGQVVVTDGTTGGVKSSGYTIAKSVPSDAVFTDNNTTYTFATGDSNGQIKVTPSGGTAQNIAVKGLGSAAYTNSGTYVYHRGNAGKSNMNDVGRLPASIGMTNLSDPGNNYDNPMNGTTKATGWHLYYDASYSDSPSGSNAWVSQIVNTAGTHKWWVRSRNGGTITDGTEWNAGWRHLVVSPQAGQGGTTTPIYIDANGATQNCSYTIAKSVPADAVFTDTKNTAGSTDSSSKLFLIGATSQAANPQTYSHDTAYVGTDGCLYSGGTKVLTAHQDISGKVNKSGDTMTGRLTTTKPINQIITGSGTAAQDKGSGVSPRYFPAKWTFNTGQTVTNGDIITIKIPCAGHDYGVFISIDNGTTYKPVSIVGTSRLTTHFGNGAYLTLVYNSSGGTNSVFAADGADARSNVTGGCWLVCNYYDTGNTYDRNRYNAAIKAWGTKIVAGNIIVGTGGLYHHLKEGTAFDISYPILYLNGDCNASATTTNTYDILNFTITTTQSITLTAYKPVYIKGTLSGTTFTPDSTTPLTQTVPTSADGKYYMFLGNATSTTAVYLTERHEIYAYKNGAFGRIVNDALSVNGYTVAKSVPSNAVFTDNDTKNTAGSTDTSSKIFLIGATSQAANPQTYSHDTAYVGTDGCLYSNSTKVLTAHQTIKQDGITGATINRFGVCDTAAATAAKVVSITNGTFSLEAGVTIAVRFTNANTATGTPTLNVNSKGAKNIFVNNVQITSDIADRELLRGTVIFVYDGTQWNLIGNYLARWVQQLATSTSADYEVLFSGTADNTTRTEIARKNSNLKFNPNTGNLTVTKVNGEAVFYSGSVSAAVNATTCTISNTNITTSSMIEPFSSNSSGNVITVTKMAVSAGKVVLTFPTLTEATSFKVRITNT